MFDERYENQNPSKHNSYPLSNSNGHEVLNSKHHAEIINGMQSVPSHASWHASKLECDATDLADARGSVGATLS